MSHPSPVPFTPVSCAEITPIAVSWLWEPYLPRGKLAILDGDPGTGKSFVTLDLAARVSAGAPMPGGVPSAPANVLLFLIFAFLIVPRLLAATIMLPVLVVLADATGLMSGYLVSVRTTDVTAEDFITGMRLGFGAFQVVYSLLKATMFGVAIALVCSYEGYITEAGAEGVGRSSPVSTAA